jgi:hypothetical protein
VLASAAAGSGVEIGDDVHRLSCLCFSSGCYPLPGYSFCPDPYGQMKPNSSRATAVAIFLLSLPAAASLI